MTDWTIISRSLRARRFSTLTTILMVAVGVALMVVLLTMRDAGRQSFTRGTGNVHLLVSRDASALTSVLNGMFYAAPPAKPLLYSEFETLRAKLPLEWAIPVQLGDSYRGGWPVLATTEEFFTKFQPAPGTAWSFASGKAFAKDFEIVLGAEAARGTGLRLGSRVILTHGTGTSRGGPVHEHDEAAFEVVGILAPSGTIHDRALFTNLNSAWLVHALDRMERDGTHAHDHAEGHDHGAFPICEDDLIPEDRKITNVLVRVATRPGSDVSSAIPVVMERIRRDPAFQAAPFTVAGPRAEVDRLMGIVGNVDRILVAMAFVVMLSSAVGIMLALYNSMEQRRRQIAVLRVLGASRGRVFSLVLTESAVIGLIGAGAGLVLGLAGAQVAAGVMRAELGVHVSPGLPAVIGMGLVAGTLALSCVAGVVPAMVAYRMSVAASLRPTA